MCFGAIIGILIIFLLAVVEIDKNKVLLNILIIVTALNFIGNSIFLVVASSTTLITNQLDKFIAQEIIKEIDAYEETTGEKIKKIGVAFDKTYTMYYEGQPELRCFNIRSMGTSWAVKEVITTYSGRKYENTTVPKEITEEFLTNDWTNYNKDQLVFDGENLYICIY